MKEERWKKEKNTVEVKRGKWRNNRTKGCSNHNQLDAMIRDPLISHLILTGVQERKWRGPRPRLCFLEGARIVRLKVLRPGEKALQERHCAMPVDFTLRSTTPTDPSQGRRRRTSRGGPQNRRKTDRHLHLLQPLLQLSSDNKCE